MGRLDGHRRCVEQFFKGFLPLFFFLFHFLVSFRCDVIAFSTLAVVQGTQPK